MSSDIGNCLLSDTPTSSLRDPEDIVEVTLFHQSHCTVVILCKALIFGCCEDGGFGKPMSSQTHPMFSPAVSQTSTCV